MGQNGKDIEGDFIRQCCIGRWGWSGEGMSVVTSAAVYVHSNSEVPFGHPREMLQ